MSDYRQARVLSLLILSAAVAGCGGAPQPESQWRSIFNGEDLTGWTPKIVGQSSGNDPFGLFRADQGKIVVDYAALEKFGGEFGHLFYDTPYSSYDLRLEYRFVGEQTAGGPEWAWRNSGVMVHAEAPERMGLEKNFPRSIEVQFLGGEESRDRKTGNLCTPDTNVEMDGALVTTHCIDSGAAAIIGDEWVQAEVRVRGDTDISHYINGELAMRYQRPQLGDETTPPGEGPSLSSGYIALQAESHGVEFRNIELRVVDR